jgi:hypothetical protein
VFINSSRAERPEPRLVVGWISRNRLRPVNARASVSFIRDERRILDEPLDEPIVRHDPKSAEGDFINTLLFETLRLEVTCFR